MPNETKTAATTTAKASKIHDPMLTLQRAVAYIVLFVLCFICLFFFYVLIVNATHNNFTIQQGFDPLPRGSFGVNFFNTTHDANVPILTGLRNSLIVSAACAALSVYFSALTAYAIYAYDFKLRKLAFTVILLIMTMPTQVSALGFLNLMDSMKLTNTLWPLILPSIAAPTVFFFMKQYMDSSLPRDIIDAARIDGCSNMGIYRMIIMPIARPMLAIIGLMSFMAPFLDYMLPKILLTNPESYTLATGLFTLINDARTMNQPVFAAGGLLSAIPVVILFISLQRQLVSGLAAGSVKG